MGTDQMNFSKCLH